MIIQVPKKRPPVEKYFKAPEDEAFFRGFSFAPETAEGFLVRTLESCADRIKVRSDENTLTFETADPADETACLEAVRSYYETYPVHITRMFGSYVLLVGENGSLRAVRATPIPIRHSRPSAR